jgi:phage terminase small subunit
MVSRLQEAAFRWRWQMSGVQQQGAGVTTAVATVKPLSAKQQLFVDEYMKDRNATQAYIRAGYSANGADGHAARLVGKGSVAAEIARRAAEYTKAAGLDVVWALERMKPIADSDLRKAFDPSTGALLPPHKWPDELAAVMESVEVVEMAGGLEITKDGAPQHIPMYTKKVKLRDKLGALKTILEFCERVRAGAPPPPPPGGVTNVQINVDKLMLAWNAPVRAQPSPG